MLESGLAPDSTTADVALVVTCYERTWRDLLTTGAMQVIAGQQCFPFRERVVLINNVRDRAEVERAAHAAVARGEVTRFVFVADYIAAALRLAGLTPRALGQHPYFLDWGLVIPLATGCDWIVGWDAEVRLEAPHDWISPAIALLEARAEIFSAGLAWPERGEAGGSIARESFGTAGPFALNWGFSDHTFLVRRRRLVTVRYDAFAPAAYCRHGNKEHPGSYEARVEAFQRSAGLARATYREARYSHNDAIGEVMDRVGRSPWDRVRVAAFGLLERLLWRFRRQLQEHPRFRLP